MNELEQVKFKGALAKFGAVAETILQEWGELDHGWIIYARAQAAVKELDIDRLHPCATVAYSDSNHEQASSVELHYYAPSAEPQPGYRNYGRITATHAPADQTRLTVYADPEYQDEMLKQWARLKAELIKQEWIDPPFTVTEAIVHEWTPENGVSRIRTMTQEQKSKLISSKTVPGKVDHFRATMQRLFIRYQHETWCSSAGIRLSFGENRQTRQELISDDRHKDRHAMPVYRKIDVTPVTRATWVVNSHPAHAAIEAYEQADGQSTRLDFIDGYAPFWHISTRDQIGAAFVEFADMIIRELQPMSATQSKNANSGRDVSIETLSNAASPTEPSRQQVAVTTSGGVNVDANDVTVGNDMVGRDKITNTQNNFYINPTLPAPVDKFASQQPSFPLVSLFPSSAGYLGRDDVSLLIRTAYVTRGLSRKPWTSEEREAIRAWLQISPLCQWMDSYLHLRSEAFSWKIDQTLADSLRLSYMPRLSPDDSPLSVKAEFYTYGVACFDVVFGTLEALERFLRLPPLSSAFLSERARRFQSEQRVLWSEAFQITLAGLATVTHPKLLQWFSGRVGPPRLHVYLLANGANLDQRIGGDVRWMRTEGIAGRDTFLQGDDGIDGVQWQAEGLEELNEITQWMWEKHLYNWGYLGFETELNQQPPESVLRELRAAYDSI